MTFLDQSAGGAEFVALAKSVACGRGRITDSIAHAEERRAPQRVVSILRAAASPGTLSNPTWAGSLADYRAIANGFLESLRSASAFDRLLERDFRRVPLRTRIATTTLAAAGSVVAEAAPTPVSRMSLAGSELELRRATSVIVMGDELMRSAEPGANAFLAAELRGAVAAATDADFVAGLTAGATTIPSSGSTAAAILADIGALLAAVPTGAQSRLALIVSADTAKALSTKATTTGALAFPETSPQGGTVAGVQVIVSDGIPPDTNGARILLVDAAQVAAQSDVVVVDASAEASLNLDDAPVTPDAATTFSSLWQQNLLALRAQRYFGYELTRPDAVAVLTGVSY